MKSYIRYSMDDNGKELEQDIEHRTGAKRNRKPERVRFTKRQSSPLPPFTFVSLGSSPRSYKYLFFDIKLTTLIHSTKEKNK